MNPVLWVDAPYSIRNEGDKSSSSFTHAEIFHYERLDLPPFSEVLIRTPEQTNKEFYASVSARIVEAASAGGVSSYEHKLSGNGLYHGCVTFYFSNSSLTTGQVAAVKEHALYSSRRHFLIWMARRSLQKDVRDLARGTLLERFCNSGGRAEQLLSLLDYALIEGLIDQDWYGWFIKELEHYRKQSCPIAWRDRDGNTVADALMPEVFKHLEKATCEH
ncbi:hypothetical protein [Pseudomonas oryzihabitans]|uniref:hypothetical protein n=1 Tax=Pseudomonas oryzihabitans TaxID=47885 RepID=UPI0005A70101|nr:hypothetical protein [Pseudomonas oryzihabitans]NMZ47046.1 hypothetical protein [Pseudomonas oryzihabitans]